ncbi:hypothetical protein ACNQGB_02015 [Flavobacterium sp. XS1P32]|uniref:hypothetical protein n=1 Tax=Flavobacterium sp. XS1P32 TaxID=3401726 RepID=UPI003AAEC6A5
MKNVFLLFSLFLMLSCSNSDDNTNSSNSDFHPPAWIQGNWIQEGTAGTSGVIFSFSANDFCMTNMGVTKQCQQEFVNLYRKSGNAVTVAETITAIVYTAEIKYFAGQSVIYSFRKLANNKIEWTAATGSHFIKQ